MIISDIITLALCETDARGFAQIAQLVEQRTENPRVTGSIPVLGMLLFWNISQTFFIIITNCFAGVVQW